MHLHNLNYPITYYFAIWFILYDSSLIPLNVRSEVRLHSVCWSCSTLTVLFLPEFVPCIFFFSIICCFRSLKIELMSHNLWNVSGSYVNGIQCSIVMKYTKFLTFYVLAQKRQELISMYLNKRIHSRSFQTLTSYPTFRSVKSDLFLNYIVYHIGYSWTLYLVGVQQLHQRRRRIRSCRIRLLRPDWLLINLSNRTI